MAESKTTVFLVQEPVEAAVWHALHNYSFENAIFLASALNAEVQTEESLALLGDCLFFSGQHSHCYELLTKNPQKLSSSKNKLLLASCCARLSKWSEVEDIIRGRNPSESTAATILDEFGQEKGAYAMHLLGQSYAALGRPKLSAEFFKRAHQVNPYLWNSWKVLCDLGMANDSMLSVYRGEGPPAPCARNDIPAVQVVYKQENNIYLIESASDVASQSSLSAAGSTSTLADSNSNITPFQTGSATKRSPEAAPLRPLEFGISKKLFHSSGTPLSPAFGVLELDMPRSGDQNMEVSPATSNPSLSCTPSIVQPSPAPATIQPPSSTQFQPVGPRVARTPNTTGGIGQTRRPTTAPVSRSTSSTVRRTPTASATSGGRIMRSVQPQQQSESESLQSLSLRRSSRLKSKENVTIPPPRLGATRSASKTKPVKTEKSDISRAVEYSFASSPAPASPRVLTPEASQLLDRTARSTGELYKVLDTISRGYLALTQYKCNDALEEFEKLPLHHQESPFVLNCVARAHCENNNYKRAMSVYAELRTKDSGYLSGLEHYAKSLNMAKEQRQLICLSKELQESNSVDPVAWIATGFCLSLAREQESAVKAFERATQLDPTHAYAYALAGLEHIELNNLEQAFASFRTAQRHDKRCVVAYVGLGQLYFKKEQHNLALIHYQLALDINPRNVNILCASAMAQHAQGQMASALSELKKAVELQPDSLTTRFHRAAMLYSIGKFSESLEELSELRQLNSSEPLIFFLLGKVYQALGKEHLAQINFSQANHLNPRYASKENIETFNRQYNPNRERLHEDFEFGDSRNDSPDMAIDHDM